MFAKRNDRDRNEFPAGDPDLMTVDVAWRSAGVRALDVPAPSVGPDRGQSVMKRLAHRLAVGLKLHQALAALRDDRDRIQTASTVGVFSAVMKPRGCDDQPMSGLSATIARFRAPSAAVVRALAPKKIISR